MSAWRSLKKMSNYRTMRKGLIGVIVPVYKTEEYIAECIESILAQTYRKFRLILVDDGSPDAAGTICDEYAAKDSRITVIHQENAGVTRARARGVEEANDCEWITFVDSDDTITEDALEHLYSYTNNHTDIILSPIDQYINPQERKIQYIEYRKLAASNFSFTDTPWGKLIRRTIFNHFVFDIPPQIKVHEDHIMNIRLAFNTEKDVYICAKNIYNYRDNNNSITHTFERDLEYYQEVQKLRIASFPEENYNDYLITTIPKRLQIWREHYLYKSKVPEMIGNCFYIGLKTDIEKTGYKMPFLHKILFYHTDPIIRTVAINIIKLQNLLNRRWKR